MQLVYLRGKNPKILKHCGYHIGYESYFRRLTRYDGVEWLNDRKVLGTIRNNKYEPEFPYNITPEYQKQVAKQLNLEIEMDSPIDGKGKALYYYKGQYNKAKDLF